MGWRRVGPASWVMYECLNVKRHTCHVVFWMSLWAKWSKKNSHWVLLALAPRGARSFSHQFHYSYIYVIIITFRFHWLFASDFTFLPLSVPCFSFKPYFQSLNTLLTPMILRTAKHQGFDNGVWLQYNHCNFTIGETSCSISRN